ncbi:hypothetical protein [Hymenobacter jeollabukensis]|uniref:Uncharacterized protein n=1 Tax=Hymenobacter jeollabukensis TaxID=2025313 RepID=A0A5R8WPU9_9BACT|nr:hypothetical protein [Hymenobacter jeollabukensis]TLM92343.1 hypothetical protein FDY95_12985 [Hymenobacter jeollabukensis]
MNSQPTFPTAHRPWLRRSLGLLLSAGLIGLMLRFVDDFPEDMQRTVFFLGLFAANALLYLLVTRRGGATPGAGQAAQTLLVALAVLIHVLSGLVVLLVSVFIWLGINPH